MPELSPFVSDFGSLTLQAVTPTPTPFPKMDPKVGQVTLELVPGCMCVGGEGSLGHASCLRIRGVDSLGVGLATSQVIRSGLFKSPPPLHTSYFVKHTCALYQEKIALLAPCTSTFESLVAPLKLSQLPN